MTWTDQVIAAGREAAEGRRRGLSALIPFVGPAMIASVAYMDPGNFATNIAAGAAYGYELVWVVVAASLMAMLFQALSARLGIVTGRGLAQIARDMLPKPVVWGMWVISEIGAMATDLAEFLGGAIGLSLLTGLPLFPALVVTGVITYGLLLVQSRGFRPMEILIGLFVGLISLCYIAELVVAPPHWIALWQGVSTPHLADEGAITLAVGIIGATVMPHVIYLHSSLTQERIPAHSRSELRRILAFSNVEVLFALGLAGFINIAMVAMAATVFHDGAHNDVADIATAYLTLKPLLGASAAMLFMVSLLGSGFSSSVVGTMAGQIIMEQFLSFHTPLWLRRAITMIPAFVVVWCGVDSTQTLILSQVVLSLVLPVPLIALIVFTSRRAIMGEFVNSWFVTVLASCFAIAILALNIRIISDTLGPFF
jgi:manganese transport protein